jgi:hypothetical protein
MGTGMRQAFVYSIRDKYMQVYFLEILPETVETLACRNKKGRPIATPTKGANAIDSNPSLPLI